MDTIFQGNLFYSFSLKFLIIYSDTENTKKLNSQDKDSLEGLFKEKELGAAVRSMKNGKSPGNDGFPVEFYKVFWPDIKDYLLNSLNSAFQTGILSISQRQGILSLKPKKDTDPLCIQNKGPISLLNVDYKIATKSLAGRLKTILPNLINEDQTGYIKSRYIGENIRQILEIMIDQTDNYNIPGLMLFIDFKKAFDTLEWSFLQKALQHFNFGPDFTKWVSTIYNIPTSVIVNNGVFSERFPISREVRQGCPLSPYLCAEVLANTIRLDQSIKGIVLNGIENKISQHADDTTLFLDGSEESLEEVIFILDTFGEISGLQINTQKTEILRVGSLKASQIELLERKKFKWKSRVKVLGIVISTNNNNHFILNFPQQLQNIKNTLNLWVNRKISLRGKITIVKTLALSKLVYLLSVLPTPP